MCDRRERGGVYHKLDRAGANRVHELLESGMSDRAVGMLVGVSRSMVSLIRRGKCWPKEDISDVKF